MVEGRGIWASSGHRGISHPLWSGTVTGRASAQTLPQAIRSNGLPMVQWGESSHVTAALKQ
jgi:hypothetical protein